MLKGKDIYTFVRFGSLNLKKQKGFGKETFHSPPAPKGFYAFPKIFQEFFLISSLDKTQPEIFPKKPKWKPVDERSAKEHFEWENFNWNENREKSAKIKSLIRREFIKKQGNLWHHLSKNVENKDVISRYNSWVKTDINAWMKAVSKETIQNRYGNNDQWLKVNSINSAKGLNGFYLMDHFEVFFDEKI